jgi:hypothetical protein
MPNRILKESICTSKELANISLGAETLFYRLIVKADDFGCYHADPEIVRNTCYTRKNIVKESHVITWLEELRKNNLIEVYYNNGEAYLHLLTFDEHQQRRANKPKYPMPSDDSSCNQMQSDAPIFENVNVNDNENVNEYKGADKPPRFTRPSVEEVNAYCTERNNGIDGQTFLDFYESKGWKIGNAPMKDWKACVRTWERRKQQPRAAPTKNNAESLKYMQRQQTDEELSGIFVDLTKEPDG